MKASSRFIHEILENLSSHSWLLFYFLLEAYRMSFPKSH
jgi:hypothetical protein